MMLLLLIGLSASAQQKQTIDKVVGLVGDQVILLSEVEAQYSQYLAEDVKVVGDLKCSILEQMLSQKLLLNQAILDSITVDDGRVEDELNRRLRYFTGQFGSQEKLEEFLGKPVILFKDELREDIRELLKAQSMQASINKNIKITPSEVATFYKSIPSDSLPYLNTEVEIGQIIKFPKVSDVQKKIAREKLEALRERVKKGEDFQTLAILYSQDNGSAKSGGELGFVNRGDLVKAFEAVAFKLKPEELSNMVETEYGFHIVQLVERRGEQVNVRHILIKPEYTAGDFELVKYALDSVKRKIDSKEVEFSSAAADFSDDEQTKNNGGMLQNQQDGTSKIPTDLLEKSIFLIIDTMQVGGTSQPVMYQTEAGKRGYRMIYYKSKTEPHRSNLDQDYSRIQAAALADKESKNMAKWFDDKRENSFIKINNDFAGCEELKAWKSSSTKN